MRRTYFGALVRASRTLSLQVPLILPAALVGVDKRLVYEGIFGRIKAAQIPISTFWLW
jgi:hypothetical protein